MRCWPKVVFLHLRMGKLLEADEMLPSVVDRMKCGQAEVELRDGERHSGRRLDIGY